MKKTVALMQPYFLPYIGYWQVLNAVDEYVMYDDVQFIKGGWINRNNILLGGQKHLFSLQLSGASPNKNINEVGLEGNFGKFQALIAQAYARAPHKDAVLELVRRICSYNDLNLARFIGNSLHEVSNYLGITTTLRYSSDVPQDRKLHAQDRVLDICRSLGATHYINAIGGQALYSKDDFAARDIKLNFLKTNFVEYQQVGNQPFVPGLSILDVMMHNSPAEVRQMLDSYELI